MSNAARLGIVAVALAALAVGAFLTLRREDATPASASAPRVVRVSDDHWVVPRSMREGYFRDPQRLNRDLRLMPVAGEKAGELRSLVIDYVGEGSPMHSAGFRKGDRILEVNGSPVATMSRALSLSQEVRSRDVLTVRIQRDGAAREFRCEFPEAKP
jgi:S1-C subfamily serine protease